MRPVYPDVNVGAKIACGEEGPQAALQCRRLITTNLTSRRNNATGWALCVTAFNRVAAIENSERPQRSPFMLIGIFADSHDHLDNIRLAVARFNAAGCELVLFAGDLVSTFAVPPLRKLECPLVGCFGDNEGNKAGLLAGMSIVGVLGEPPFCHVAPDGTRILLAHMQRQLRGAEGDFDVAVYAHTHRASIRRDERGRLHVNPGETSGWTYGRPTVALLQTRTMRAEIVELKAHLAAEECRMSKAE